MLHSQIQLILNFTVKVNEVIESPARAAEGEEGDSGIDANSQGSCSSTEVKAGAGRRKEKKKKKPPPGQQQAISTLTNSIPSTSTKPVENVSKTSVFSFLFFILYFFFIILILIGEAECKYYQ